MDPVVEFVPGRSGRAKRFERFLRLAIKPWLFGMPLTPSTLRLAGVFELGAPLVMRTPRGTEIERVEFDGFHGEWIRPANADPSRVLLYFHGGGFFFCGLKTHRRMIAKIAEAAGVTAFSVAYRQLPRAPLTTSTADAQHAYEWLLAQGFAGEHIALGGDSAGGFLALNTALTAAEQGRPVPAAIAALAPLVTLDHVERAAFPYTRKDAYIPVHRLERLKRLLLSDGDVTAPADRDLRPLPPMLVVTGSHEALRYDTDLLAQRLADAGVPHKVEIFEKQIHVFPAFSGVIPEADRAIGDIASFVRTHLAPSAVGSTAA
ncbi:alpha/beta hydrolase [Actinomadura rayongensis]|uniref:Alpha/beta hydrolase fold domain-containing protein n=1 Tax=Actinomadura rayongensis TaxID=1429076 RepID=A0A6I4WER1_9ACTN|nr:alpha/beta hydrolase [Actinomadura rayongensis]MXQ68308.1 alpha/beta hydrolase fold domain-containing protein [Actinomadura rayongensis]